MQLVIERAILCMTMVNLNHFKRSINDLYLPVNKMFSPEYNENKFKFLVKIVASLKFYIDHYIVAWVLIKKGNMFKNYRNKHTNEYVRCMVYSISV